MLYFMFVKWMCIGFLIVSLIAVPAMFSNMAGTGISSEEEVSYLDSTTLANQDNVVADETAANEDIEDQNRFDRYLVIYSDVVYTIFLISWMAIFKCYA